MSIVTQDEETPFDFRRQQLVERNFKAFVNTLQGAAFDFSPILKSRLQNRALPHLHTCNEHHCAGRLGPIRPSVDGLYRDGTVYISREMHKQCFITRRETTSGAPKLHRYRSADLSLAIGTPYGSLRTFVSPHEKSLICEIRIFVIILQ